MKKVALALVMLGTSSAFAAKFETCVKEVAKQCGPISAAIAANATDSADCKMVEAAGLPKKVVFYDNNTIASVQVTNCDHNTLSFNGNIEEAKVLNGRLLVRTTAGHVLVVARDNSINFLTNAKGHAVENISDIKIDQKSDSVQIQKVDGSTYSLTADQIGKKMSLIQD